MQALGSTIIVCSALLAALLPPMGGMARAQTQTAASFEDVAQQAQAVLGKQPAEAARLYRKAVEIRPDWAEGWFYLGASLYDLDRYAESRDAFRKEVKLAPRMAPGWAFLGLAEAELDDAEQALTDIRQGEALGIKGNHDFEVAVRLKAATLLIKAQAFDEALLQLRPLADGSEGTPAMVEAMGLCALAVPHPTAELGEQERAVVRLTGKAAWALVS